MPLLVRTTTTRLGPKVAVRRRIARVTVPVDPEHTGRSLFVDQRTLPVPVREALRSQTANVQLVRGATDTSRAFAQSVQAPILPARSG